MTHHCAYIAKTVVQVIWQCAIGMMALCGAPSVIGAEPPQAFVPPVYEIRRAGTPITIDGKLEEPAWIAAPATDPFHFPWFEDGERDQSIVKMLWDDQCIYIAHICQDAHLTARHTKHDDPVPEDDCFEIMIVPDPKRPNYHNIEWNVLGAYVDGRRPDGPKAPRVEWDVKGFRHAGFYVGTPNDDSDRDAYWIGEVAIPLDNFADLMPRGRPSAGDEWRVNFNRHGGDVNMQYSQWSPVDSPTPSFHAPHRFGRAIFSDRTSPFAPAKKGGSAALQDDQHKP